MLLLQAVGDTFVHGGATGHDDVLAKLLADVDIGLLDGGPCEVGWGHAVEAVEGGVEEEFGAAHTDGTGEGHHSLVGEGVLDVVLGGLGGGLLLLSVVLGDEGVLLLDVADDLDLGGGGKGLTVLEEELLHVVGEDTSSDLHLLDGVGEGESFEDGDGVGNTITSIDDETGGTSSGVEGHDGDGVSHTVPVFEGFSLPHAVEKMEIAGRVLTNYMH